MKKIIITTSILASLLFFNCSKDDTASNNEESVIDVEQNTAEEINIEVATLEDGISIEGATLETGTLSPNEQTTFSVTETEQSGFQDVGFEIELNVPDNYAGAYLQLLDEDGTPSANYYDIPGFSYSYKKLNIKSINSFFLNEKNRKNTTTAAKTLEEDSSVTIEVDFDSTVPAGSFCYYLCIYDEDGNISAPQTLCVEVEAWGGNDNLIGNWTFTKVEFTEYGKNYTQNAGEENCEDGYDYTESCYDDLGNLINEVEINECDTIFSLLLNINSDGTQNYSVDSIYENLNYELFNDTCTVEFDTYGSKDNATGNWAYDEEEKKLTIVDYTYEEVETKNGEPYVDEYQDDYDYEIGVGFDLYVTKATSSELVLEYRDIDRSYNGDTETYDEYEYKVVYYFTK